MAIPKEGYFKLEDWKTNPPSFSKYVAEHQCPSFLEYREYPYGRRDQGLEAQGNLFRDARLDAIDLSLLTEQQIELVENSRL